jgi:hypothetical protein
MKKSLFLIYCIFFLSISVCYSQDEFPEKYKSLYSQYKAGLEKYNAYLDKETNRGKSSVCFGTELLAANSNRGEDLLQPLTLTTVKLTLDRFEELGIQGVTLAIGYPVLTDDISRSGDYLDFYRKVAAMVRNHNMKLCVKIHVMFSGTVFSTLKSDFSNLTVEKLTSGKRVMAERILSELSPDYLTLGGEPDTEAKLTGLKQLNDPEKYADMVRSILKNLNKGKTLVGVGQGTWSTPDFAKAFAQTDIDFINLHIYPIGKRVFEVINQVISIANKNNKRMILDECWLYKADKGEGLDVNGTAVVYTKDHYSFWQPADKLFLEAMAKIANNNNIEYVSPFWSHCFFANLKYDSSDERLSYSEANRKFVKAVVQNMQSDKFSETGLFYSKLIKKYGDLKK